MVPSPTTSVLLLGGLDPTSGAGLTADVVTCARLGAHAFVVATALTVQDTRRVHAWAPVAEDEQLRALEVLAEDATPHVIKTGMLGGPAGVATLRRALERWPDLWVVVDPVLAGGSVESPSLATPELVSALLTLRGPRLLLTPNVTELAALLGEAPAADHAALEGQALRLARMLPASVLAKGGHLEPPGTDLLIVDGEVVVFSPGRPWSGDLRGTGCALATTIAVGLARGRTLPDAIADAKLDLEDRSMHTIRVGGGRSQFSPAPRGSRP